MKKTVLDILKEVEAESGKLKKVDILKKNADNEALRLTVLAALNPFMTYGIKKIPDYKPNTTFDGAPLVRVIQKGLPPFIDRLLTGNRASAKLAQFLEALSEDDAEVLKRIIDKDLRCGFATSTANKVWEGLIPQYCYMGAVAYSDDIFDNLLAEGELFSQVKENGMFTAFETPVGDNKPTAHTRRGKPLDFKGQFDEWMFYANKYVEQKYSEMFPKGVRFDGEMLVVKEGEESVYEDRKISNGITCKAEKGTMTEEEASRIRFVVWDLCDAEKAYTGFYGVPYKTRLDIVNEIINNVNHYLGAELVKPVETYFITTREEAEEHYKMTVAKGLEGTIIKSLHHAWKDGKHKHQMKLKVFCEVELEVVDCNESAKNPNTLGSLLCKTKCGQLTVNVGSGFTKKQVEELWLNRERLTGRILTVQFCELSSNAKGENSLVNPVFIEFRTDKFESDTFEQVVEQYQAKIGSDSMIRGGKS